MPQTYQELYDCYARSGSSSKENLCLRSGVWPRSIVDEGDSFYVGSGMAA